MVRLVRVSLAIGATTLRMPRPARSSPRRAPVEPPHVSIATASPPNEWMTPVALIPRPPADSPLDLM
jgi:hypothetical protein